ncbi:hypothetical protein EON64_04125 [archaeon]|nr:MAG: hypothetical protein EON64_04125 [archaeon]
MGDVILERLEQDMRMHELIREVQRIEDMEGMMDVITFQPASPSPLSDDKRRKDDSSHHGSSSSPVPMTSSLGVDDAKRNADKQSAGEEDKPKKKNLGANIQVRHSLINQSLLSACIKNVFCFANI